MTVKDATSGMTSTDLWKWVLGAVVSITLALGLFVLGQLAQASTARLDRLERATDTLTADRQQDAGDIRELRANLGNISWRLDQIDRKLDEALSKP